MKNYSQELGLNFALVPKKERYVGEVSYKFKNTIHKTTYYSNWNYMNFAMMDLITFLFIQKIQNIHYDGSIPPLQRRLDIHKIYEKDNIRERLDNPTWDLELEITDENIRLHPLFKKIEKNRDILNILEKTSRSKFDLLYGIKIIDMSKFLPLTRKHIRICDNNIFDLEVEKRRNNNKYKLKFESYLGRCYSYNVHAFNTFRQPENFYKINQTCQHAVRFLSTFKKPWIVDEDELSDIFNYKGNENYKMKQLDTLLRSLKQLRIIRGYERKVIYRIW